MGGEAEGEIYAAELDELEELVEPDLFDELVLSGESGMLREKLMEKFKLSRKKRVSGDEENEDEKKLREETEKRVKDFGQKFKEKLSIKTAFFLIVLAVGGVQAELTRREKKKIEKEEAILKENKAKFKAQKKILKAEYKGEKNRLKLMLKQGEGDPIKIQIELKQVKMKYGVKRSQLKLDFKLITKEEAEKKMVKEKFKAEKVEEIK